MKVMRYEEIKKLIEKSKYKRYFKEIKHRNGETYFNPIKYSPNPEFRNLVVLAMFPYIRYMSSLFAKRWLKLYQSTDFMDADDFFQDIIESILKHWKWWDIKKSSFVTAIRYFGQWRITDIARKYSPACDTRSKKRSHSRVYKFVLENFKEVAFHEFINDCYSSGRIHINDDHTTLDEAVIVKMFLEDIRGVLKPREWEMFKQRFLENRTMNDIAKRNNLTEARVSQLFNPYTGISGKINQLREAWAV
jgi:RNA polymerase sigma factor (sigma-70 family)